MSTPVRGRVAHDIRQSQDDGGNVRNCSNLHAKARLKIGKSSVLPQRTCNFVSRELRGKVPFFLFASNTKLFQFVVEVQENVQQRSMTYVCKCKRTCSSVA